VVRGFVDVTPDAGANTRQYARAECVRLIDSDCLYRTPVNVGLNLAATMRRPRRPPPNRMLETGMLSSSKIVNVSRS
jgi:hypothetical protein